ncbi:hypothetical protein D3C75_1014430 [compost metagenome]
MAGIGALTDAIHQRQHAIFTIATHENVLAITATGAIDGNARHTAQHIAGTGGGLALRRIGLDHRDHHRRFKTAARIAGGGYRHGFVADFVLFNRCRRRGRRRGFAGLCKSHRRQSTGNRQTQCG